MSFFVFVFEEWIHSVVHGCPGKPHGCGAVPSGEWRQPEHCYRGERSVCVCSEADVCIRQEVKKKTLKV